MSIGRPREFEPQQALEAAMHLFWRQGYEATSLQDLLETMHLSKSSLYQTFGSKHALFQQCIEHYRAMMSSGLQQSLAAAPSGRKFIEGFFSAVVEDACQAETRIGCLLMNTATELAQHDEQIGRLTKQGTEKFAAIFRQAVEQAQREGEIPPDKDAQRLGHFLMSSLSGLNSMAKAGASRRVLQDIVQEILRSLD